jgi:hypothetical protein
MAFFNIFYAIPFHGYPEIPWPLYLFSRHMSISMSCTIPFMSYLERLFLFCLIQTSQQCSINRPLV